MDAAVKIKRLFLEGEPGTRRGLYWEDEYGTWMIGDDTKPNGFALGLLVPATIEENAPHDEHPELVTVHVHMDYAFSGETGPTIEQRTIQEPRLIEAFRRLNALWYDNLPAGDIELPVPGVWHVDVNMFPPQRIRDL